MGKVLAKVTVVVVLAVAYLTGYTVASNVHANIGRDFGYAYVGQGNSTGVYVGKVNSGVLLLGFGCEIWPGADHALFVADCFRQGEGSDR